MMAVPWKVQASNHKNVLFDKQTEKGLPHLALHTNVNII